MRDVVKKLQNKWTAVAAMLVCLVVAALSIASFSSAGTSPENNRTLAVQNLKFDVYRPSAKDWMKARVGELRPLDILIQGGQVFHVKQGSRAGNSGIAAVPLGVGSKAQLERHNSGHDPQNVTYPNRPNEIVYAKWQGMGPWTFVHLGIVKHDQKFVFEGREFITRFNADGTCAVKPTGNVLSKVTGVWSEHHEKQLHLTLHFPQTGETSKIITTHEHPFYVPSTKTWVDAENLKVGTDLHTCDGTPARVQKWQEVNEPFTAYNISVEHTHNYYVADADNPDAPAVLVHNACRFGKLRDHFQRHGSDLGVNNVRDYYNQASKHIETGKGFKVRHNGAQKMAYVTRLGSDKYMFTSASRSGGKIFTHLAVNKQYLTNKGITLPDGF